MSIHVISFDYDLCLRNGSYSTLPQVEPAIVAANLNLLKRLREEGKNYERNIVLLGSGRQSKDLDDHFAKATESCFPEIKQVADWIDAEFNPFLMADLYNQKKHGDSYKLALDPTPSEPHPKTIYDDSKITTLYAQIHKMASENPAEEIVFDFFDDKLPLVKDLKEFYSKYPDMIPKNVRFNLYCYKGGEAELVATIRGTGIVDTNYAETVEEMVRKVRKKDPVNDGSSYQKKMNVFKHLDPDRLKTRLHNLEKQQFQIFKERIKNELGSLGVPTLPKVIDQCENYQSILFYLNLELPRHPLIGNLATPKDPQFTKKIEAEQAKDAFDNPRLAARFETRLALQILENAPLEILEKTNQAICNYLDERYEESKNSALKEQLIHYKICNTADFINQSPKEKLKELLSRPLSKPQIISECFTLHLIVFNYNNIFKPQAHLAAEHKTLQSQVRPKKENELFNPDVRGRQSVFSQKRTRKFGITKQDNYLSPVNWHQYEFTPYKYRAAANPNSPLVQSLKKKGIPFIAGPSGTAADCFVGLSFLMPELKFSEIQEYFNLLAAAEVAQGHHAFHEIILTLMTQGHFISEELKENPNLWDRLDYQKSYENFLSERFKQTKAYQQLVSHYPMYLHPARGKPTPDASDCLKTMHITRLQRQIRASSAFRRMDGKSFWKKTVSPLDKSTIDHMRFKAFSENNLARLKAQIGEMTGEENKLFEHLIAQPIRLTHFTKTKSLKKIKTEGSLFSNDLLRKKGISFVDSSDKDQHIGNLDFVFFRLQYQCDPITAKSRFGKCQVILDAHETALSSIGWVTMHDLQNAGEVGCVKEVRYKGQKVRSYKGNQDRDLTKLPLTYHKIDEEDKVEVFDTLTNSFVGEDIAPGIALLLIRELRWIGGDFQRDHLTSEHSPEKLEKLLSGLFRPEAKIPSSVNLPHQFDFLSPELVKSAIEENNSRKIEELKNEGVAINKPYSAIFLACSLANDKGFAIIPFLEKMGGTWKDQGTTAGHFAAESGSLKCLEACLQSIDIDTQDTVGETMLMKACRTGQAQVIEFLLNKGANPELKNSAGEDALSIALKNSQSECFANKILAKKTDLSKKDLVKNIKDKQIFDLIIQDYPLEEIADLAIEIGNYTVLTYCFQAGFSLNNCLSLLSTILDKNNFQLLSDSFKILKQELPILLEHCSLQQLNQASTRILRALFNSGFSDTERDKLFKYLLDRGMKIDLKILHQYCLSQNCWSNLLLIQDGSPLWEQMDKAEIYFIEDYIEHKVRSPFISSLPDELIDLLVIKGIQAGKCHKFSTKNRYVDYRDRLLENKKDFWAHPQWQEGLSVEKFAKCDFYQLHDYIYALSPIEIQDRLIPLLENAATTAYHAYFLIQLPQIKPLKIIPTLKRFVEVYDASDGGIAEIEPIVTELIKTPADLEFVLNNIESLTLENLKLLSKSLNSHYNSLQLIELYLSFCSKNVKYVSWSKILKTPDELMHAIETTAYEPLDILEGFKYAKLAETFRPLQPTDITRLLEIDKIRSGKDNSAEIMEILTSVKLMPKEQEQVPSVIISPNIPLAESVTEVKQPPVEKAEVFDPIKSPEKFLKSLSAGANHYNVLKEIKDSLFDQIEDTKSLRKFLKLFTLQSNEKATLLSDWFNDCLTFQITALQKSNNPVKLKLAKSLQKERGLHLKNHLSLKDYTNRCINHINTADKQIENDEEWKPLVANLLLFFSVLGTVAAMISIYHRMSEGRYLFFDNKKEQSEFREIYNTLTDNYKTLS